MRVLSFTDRISRAYVIISFLFFLLTSSLHAQECANLQVLGSGYFCNEVGGNSTDYFINISLNGTGSYTIIDTFGNTSDVIVNLAGSVVNTLFGPFTDGDSHYIVIEGPGACESFVIAADAYDCQPTDYCESNTPYIELDFTGSPDAFIGFDPFERGAFCCGAIDNGQERCIELRITLDELSAGLALSIEGAPGLGSQYVYTLLDSEASVTCPLYCNSMMPADCGQGNNPVDTDCNGGTGGTSGDIACFENGIQEIITPVCLEGGSTYSIFVCKPGGNEEAITVESVPIPNVETDSITRLVEVGSSCEVPIDLIGFDGGTILIEATDANPGAESLLSCTDCDAPIFSPPLVSEVTEFFYRACGMPPTSDFTDECLGNITYCDTFFIRVLPPIVVAGLGPDIFICEGDPIDTTISLLMAPTGGLGDPYNISWTLPDNSQVMGTDTFLNATMAGTYVVDVRDTSSTAYCQPYTDTLLIIETLDVCCMLNVTCPDSVGGTFSCLSEIPDFDIGSISVLDSCDVVTRTSMETSTGAGCIGDTLVVTRTFLFDDGTSMVDCSIEYKVVDVAPPTITCPIDVTINCGDPTDTMSLGMPMVSDGCLGDVTITFSDQMMGGNCPDEMIIERTFVASDSCGNMNNCVQEIMVQDMTAPMFVDPAPNDTTVTCVENIPPSVTLNATDDCGSMFMIGATEVVSDSTCPNGFTLTRTWLVMDPCDNADSLQQVITVDDNVNPTLVCPMDVTLDCPADTMTSNTGMATVMDNCMTGATLSYSDNVISGACPQSFVVERTWLAVDACMNDTMCVQMIFVQDTIAPMIVCPADTTIECTVTNLSGLGMATATDDCDPSPMITSIDLAPTVGQCAQEMIILRRWFATDACGNVDSCDQTITQIDTVAPMIVCPADTMIECTVTDLSGLGMATATDNCDSAPMITFMDQAPTVGQCAQEMIILRRWFAEDACGNIDSCDQTITQIDTVAPIIVCPADTMIECTVTDLSGLGMATATDNCDSAPMITFEDQAPTVGQCAQEMIVLRRWFAEDACGNIDSCDQTITQIDTVAPIIVCPADTMIECTVSDLSNLGMATATDNCDPSPIITFMDQAPTAGGCGQEMSIIRRWFAEDACGNIDSCDQSISLIDTIAPMIVCPVDTMIECTVTDLSGLGMATATDNCDSAPMVTFEDQAPTVGQCAQEMIILRRWFAMDACGNVDSCDQTITQIDTVAPMIVCPADTMIECTVSDLSNLGMATATDNCDSAPMITSVDLPPMAGGCGQEMSIIRRWFAEDACGNIDSCDQAITMIDTVAPMIVCPADTMIECTVTDLSGLGMATATDNCDSTPMITFEDQSPVVGQCPQEMIILRRWFATDACGNIDSCDQTITQIDTVAPMIVCPADTMIECTVTDLSGLGMATATDNCDAAPMITFEDQDPVVGQCPQEMIILRRWFATDGCGNIDSCDQTITQIDTVAPIIVCPADTMIECTVTDLSGLGMATATDNCDSAPMITFEDQDPVVGQCPQEMIILRRWFAEDACGNIDSCDQTITKIDTVAPTFTLPPDMTIECGMNIMDLMLTGNITNLSDNCDDDPTSDFMDIMGMHDCDGTGEILRIWSATDGCMNMTVDTQRLVIDDNTGPNFMTPPDVTIECTDDPDDLNLTGIITDTTDICSVMFLVDYEDDTTGLTGCNETGVIIRTWTVSDECDNTTEMVQNIAVIDTVPPVAMCMDFTIDVMGDTLVEILPENIDAGSMDLCGAVTLEVEPAVFTCETFADSVMVNLIATDACDNKDTCEAKVFFLNYGMFELVCPGDTCAVLPPGLCEGVVEYDVSVADLCGVTVTLTQVDTSGFTSGDVFPRGTYVQKYMAVGSNGQVDSCEFTIEVKDAPDNVLQCKSFIQVSLDQDCKATITIEDLLIGGSFGCPDDLTVCPKDTTLGIMNNMLTGEHVGMDVIFSVKNDEGNSCWTTVRVEDKLAPSGLICAKDSVKCYEGIDPMDIGFPIPDTAMVISHADGIYLIEGVDPCGPVEMTFNDEPVPMTCDDPFQEVIYRTWTAVDPSGNSATCRDTICVERATIADLILPGNFDGITNDPLYCGDDCFLPDGSPDPACTGDPGRLCDNIFTTYTDVISEECPGKQKVFRTWQLIDWCADEVMEHRQTILVKDTLGPEIMCPSDVTVESDVHDCEGAFTMPIPDATDACSEAELHLVLSPSAQQENLGTSIRFSGMALGDHEIVWIFKDLCNNQSRCTTTVHVVDMAPPESVCNLHIEAGLTSSGLVKVFASTIDNGSHDNCNPVFFKVLRMDDELADSEDGGTSVNSTASLSCDGVNGDDSPYPGNQVWFDDYVKFCCGDIGQNPQVIFRVFDTDPGVGPVDRHRMNEGGDLFGHYNDCMVIVDVFDNLPPTIECPRDTVVTCDFDLDMISTLGTPIVDDNCGYRLREEVIMPDNCDLDRVIIRRFTVIDSSGLTATCDQTILINQTDVFNITDTRSRCSSTDHTLLDDVEWPCDLEVSSCSIGIEPDDLDDNQNINPTTGEAYSLDARPDVFHHPCAQLLIDHLDDEILDVNGNCIKILREWTIIDWCQFDADVPNPVNPANPFGMWTYTQEIVINTDLADGAVDGLIRTFYDEPVMNHEVMIFESDDIDMTDPMETTFTIEDGSYAFSGLAESGNYSLIPYNNGGAANGITTLDLIGIMRHIIGLEPFVEPNIFIAADVDNNQVVNVLDVLHLQEITLGLRHEFTNNTSWRYVANPELLSVDNPFEFDELIEIDEVNLDGQNFRAIKIGDVNGSAENQASGITQRSGGLELYIDPTEVKSDERRVEIPVRASDFTDLSGYQLTLDFDADKMKFIDIQSGTLEIKDQNVSAKSATEGLISMNWFDGYNHTYISDDVLFTLIFEGEFSDQLSISDDGVRSESYRNSQIFGVNLTIGLPGDYSFTLYQNIPNPFNDETKITFDLIEDDLVTMIIYDINGKVIYQDQTDMKKGKNERIIKSSDLGGAGIYYYQIITDDQSATKKMIMTD